MRSLVITMVVLLFSLLMSLTQAAGALPWVNSAATSQWGENGVQQLIVSQNVTSSDLTGYVGYFNIGIKLITGILNVMLGTLIVAIPLTQMGMDLLTATAIQTVLYALVGFDLLVLWRGVQW